MFTFVCYLQTSCESVHKNEPNFFLCRNVELLSFMLSTFSNVYEALYLISVNKVIEQILHQTNLHSLSLLNRFQVYFLQTQLSQNLFSLSMYGCFRLTQISVISIPKCPQISFNTEIANFDNFILAESSQML